MALACKNRVRLYYPATSRKDVYKVSVDQVYIARICIVILYDVDLVTIAIGMSLRFHIACPKSIRDNFQEIDREYDEN